MTAAGPTVLHPEFTGLFGLTVANDGSAPAHQVVLTATCQTASPSSAAPTTRPTTRRPTPSAGTSATCSRASGASWPGTARPSAAGDLKATVRLAAGSQTRREIAWTTRVVEEGAVRQAAGVVEKSPRGVTHAVQDTAAWEPPGDRASARARRAACSFALIAARPPDGRGEDAPAAPPPPEVVWGPRISPQNAGPAVEAPSDPWKPRRGPSPPVIRPAACTPVAGLPSRRTRRPPVRPGGRRRRAVDAAEGRAAPPPPPRTDAPPFLPPPRPFRDDPDKPAPPDGDRAVLLGAAHNAVRQQKWDVALARFEEYFKRFGEDFELRKEYAGVLVQAGRVRDALAEYRRLAALKPGDRDVLVSLADAAVQARSTRRRRRAGARAAAGAGRPRGRGQAGPRLRLRRRLRLRPPGLRRLPGRSAAGGRAPRAACPTC